MNFQTLHLQRKLILAVAVAGIISIFLPWFSAGAFGFSVHINGFRGWGVLAFFAFAVAGILSIIGTQTEALDKNIWFGAIICGAIALLSVVITLLSSQTGDFGFAGTSIGFGLWISLIASILVLIFSWIYKKPSNSLKSGFDSIKQTVSTTASSLSTNTHSTAPATSNRITELERLSKLKENGTITEEEFLELKSKLL